MMKMALSLWTRVSAANHHRTAWQKKARDASLMVSVSVSVNVEESDFDGVVGAVRHAEHGRGEGMACSPVGVDAGASEHVQHAAFVDPRVGLAAVGGVPNDGVVPLVGCESGRADEVTNSVGEDVIDPFLGVGTIKAYPKPVVAQEGLSRWIRGLGAWCLERLVVRGRIGIMRAWKVQASGRWSIRFLWSSRDCERMMPRPRGVSSCRIQ